MRTRHDDQTALLPCYTESTNCSNVMTHTDWTDSRLKNGVKRTTSDVVTKGFKKRSAKGEIINSPFWSVSETWACTAGVGGYDYTATPCTGVKRYRQSAFGLSLVQIPAQMSLVLAGDPLVASLKSEAASSARSSIEEPVLQSLVELADARKIITGLAGSAFKFASVMNQIRKSREFNEFLKKRSRTIPSDPRVLANEFMNFMASNWLKYRYMIMPIYLSSVAVLKDLEKKPPMPERQTFRGFATDSTSDEIESNSENTAWTFNLTYNTVRRIDVRAGFLTDLVRDLAVVERYGLTWADVPSAAWELIPFSFIVDWFVNVGDVIASHRPLVGRRTLASWTTVTETTVWGFTLETVGKPASGYSKIPCTTTGTISTVVKQRIPGANINLTLRSADVNLLTYWNRITDATALVKLIFAR